MVQRRSRGAPHPTEGPHAWARGTISVVTSLDEFTSETAEPPDEIKYVIDAAREAIVQEFQIAERLDSKGRTQVTLAAGFFTVAQAVAAGTLASQGIAKAWLVAVIVIAAVAGLIVAITLKETFEAWRLLDERDVKPDRLRSLAEESYADDRLVPGKLAKIYASILEARRENNETRARRFEEATEWMFRAMAITIVELIVAMAARLLT
jgi:hypothetical protein